MQSRTQGEYTTGWIFTYLYTHETTMPTRRICQHIQGSLLAPPGGIPPQCNHHSDLHHCIMLPALGLINQSHMVLVLWYLVSFSHQHVFVCNGQFFCFWFCFCCCEVCHCVNRAPFFYLLIDPGVCPRSDGQKQCYHCTFLYGFPGGHRTHSVLCLQMAFQGQRARSCSALEAAARASGPIYIPICAV